MAQQRSVKLSRIVDEFSLEILHKGSDYDSALLTIVDVNRPGLQYAGFFEYFDPRRLQVEGKAEHTYLSSLLPEERRKSYSNLFSYEIPALVLSRDMEHLQSVWKQRVNMSALCCARLRPQLCSPAR